MSDTMTCKYGVIRKAEYMTEGAFVGTFKVMVEKEVINFLIPA